MFVLAGRALADEPGADAPAAASEPPTLTDVLDELALDDALAEEEIDGDVEIDAEEIMRATGDAGAVLVEDSAAAASGLVDADVLQELRTPHRAPPRWGRLDLSLVWRHAAEQVEPVTPAVASDAVDARDAVDVRDTVDARDAVVRVLRRHEVWLLATWSH